MLLCVYSLTPPLFSIDRPWHNMTAKSNPLQACDNENMASGEFQIESQTEDYDQTESQTELEKVSSPENSGSTKPKVSSVP